MTAPSARNLINMNFYDNHFTYMFINHISSGGGAAPIGATFDAVSPHFGLLLDPVTGYPNSTTVNGHNWQCASIQIPKSSDFSGPWALAWQGDGQITANFGATWTELNAATATSTITSGNVDIPTATQNYVALQKITFGTTRGNIIAGTTYVICPTGLTTTNIRIASSQANALTGTFITPSGGTGSSTITPKGNGSYTRNSNATWTANQTSTSSDCYIVFSDLTNAAFAAPILGGNTHVQVLSTGGGSNGFLHNVRWYRLADEDDLLAGNIFRKAWKQELVSLNPSAIRFMNWTGGNTDHNMRWENRVPPSLVNYNGNFTAGPAYGDSAASVNNQLTVTGVGAVGSRPATPASMQHGEVACFRVGAAITRAETGFNSANSVSVNPTGGGAGVARGTCGYTHEFNVGDWVVHQGAPGTGTIFANMPHLHRSPVQLTAVTSTTYDFAYTGGGSTGTGQVGSYISLNVGTGNDRAPAAGWPITFPDGNFVSFYGFGSVRLPLHAVMTPMFDKNSIATFDGAGNPRYGAWILPDTAQNWLPTQGVAPEICTAMINEVNALSVSQGITNPIHMWVNCPVAGMVSIDPDYSSGSNWPVNFINTVINGGTVNSVTYAGLTAAANIFLEYSNETWNAGNLNFPNSYLKGTYANARFYSQFVVAGVYPYVGNFQDGTAIRAACMSRDVKAAFPGNTRIQTVMGFQVIGFFPGVFGASYEMYYGQNTDNTYPGYYYNHDAAVTGGSWGSPGSNLDAVCIATYITPYDTYFSTTTGTGNLTDDGAKYLGTDNSGAVSFTGGTGSAVAATFTSGSASIAGVNSFVADQPVVFDATVGNITADGTTNNSVYGVSSVGLSGTHFQVYLRSQSFAGTPVVVSSNGSANCLPLTSTLTTTAVATGPIVVGQLLATANTTNKIVFYGTVVTAVAGVSPNLTLTLSAPAGINNGTALIKSPANGGGNYIGAANQSGARQHIADQIVASTTGGNNGYYQDIVKSGGAFDQYSGQAGFTGILPGKYVLMYEGALELFGETGANDFHGHTNTYADTLFLNGVMANSPEVWTTALKPLWDNFTSRANCRMPAAYIIENVNTSGEQGNPAWVWAYCSPDAYASGVEGQMLLNNSQWTGMSMRNLAINDGDGVPSTDGRVLFRMGQR